MNDFTACFTALEWSTVLFLWFIALLKNCNRSNDTFKMNHKPAPPKKVNEREIIVCLFSSRCSACREVYEWICFPGDGCVDATMLAVLTLTVFLCMDHFIYLICRMISSSDPGICTLFDLAGQHFSLAQVGVYVCICAAARVCCSSHPAEHSSCHRHTGQKLIHVRFQGGFSLFSISRMLVDRWQSACGRRKSIVLSQRQS